MVMPEVNLERPLYPRWVEDRGWDRHGMGLSQLDGTDSVMDMGHGRGIVDGIAGWSVEDGRGLAQERMAGGWLRTYVLVCPPIAIIDLHLRGALGQRLTGEAMRARWGSGCSGTTLTLTLTLIGMGGQCSGAAP